MATRAFAPGFRLSKYDVVVLLVGGVGGAACLGVDFRLAFGVWYVVAHFFLFCNVLRMARVSELVWAGVFVGLVIATVNLDLISWPLGIGCSLFTTVVVAAIEIRKPSYHGVGWRRINPGLPEWWRAHQALGERV